MEKYIFDQFLDDCVEITESTSYLEILNYSDPNKNSCEEHPLTLDEFENFLHRRGAFAPPDDLGPGVKLLSGLRLVVQMNAKHNETFTPKYISLPRDQYGAMVNAFHLPRKTIETTAVVGPFFWSTVARDKEDDTFLHIIHRKSDVRKKGKTRGWELTLSHSFGTRITSGYIKGTPSSDVIPALAALRASSGEAGHPLLLPVVLLARDLSPDNDRKQREARDWLRHLESAVSLRDEVDEAEMNAYANAHGHPSPGGVGGGNGGGDLLFEVDGLSRDLVECHGNVLWKRPQAYAGVTKEMEKAVHSFMEHRKKALAAAVAAATTASTNDVQAQGRPAVSDAERDEARTVERLHESMLSRIDFYQVKLQGLENYIHTTLARLKVQREALYSILSQREARLNLEIAGEQKKIAHASKRDSTAMKTLSLLGAIFLPGTYLASVFGMSFFNFEADAAPVSNEIWIYFVTAVPITVFIVVGWLWFDHRREARHKMEDKKLKTDIEKMEKEIMAHLRQRALNKTRTWKSATATMKA